MCLTTGTDPCHTDRLHQAVLAWYADHGRRLPWREPGCSAWGVLVSEVMLQQTPVKRVLGPWRDWLTRWPTPADLARTIPADVLTVWGHLGYPRRALRLREAAQIITREHAGVVPSSIDVLLTLPGIGVYTANAVAAFAYHIRAVVLDTNIRRVITRAVGGEALPAPTITASERQRAEAVLPAEPETSVTWNIATMDLGALLCTAASPDCESCPAIELCAWRANGRPADRHATRRRPQPWAGTDRQLRGLIMAALREGPVAETALAPHWPDAAQRRRAIESLITDGLAERDRSVIRLPLT